MAGYDATVAIGDAGKVKQYDGHTVGASVAPIQKEPLSIFGDNDIRTEKVATGEIDTGEVKQNDGHTVGASLAYTPNIFGDNSAHLTEKQRRGSVFC